MRDTEIVAVSAPNLYADDRGRLHRVGAPAVEWSDEAYWFCHGVQMPDDVMLDPAILTVTRVRAERNAEVRREMLNLYGRERFMADAGARVIEHLDESYPVSGLRDARLLAIAFGADDHRYIDLRDSAVQPDGSRRRYLIRVDPGRYDGEAGTRAHAAAASLYRRPEDRSRLFFHRWQDYAPAVET